jgi:2,4-dichlorophenol 6-monooxygenase
LIQDDRFTLLHAHPEYPSRAYDISGMLVPLHAVNIESTGAPAGWKGLVNIDGESCILIRPDQHVLGHLSNADEVEQVLRQYLGTL